MMTSPLSSTDRGTARAGFDAVADSYDATFTDTRLGRWLREAVWRHLAAAFRLGDHVLELGCGTGEDAIWLARRGLYVTATDTSPGMLEVARRKVEATGLQKRISLQRLDLSRLAEDSLDLAPMAATDPALTSRSPSRTTGTDHPTRFAGAFSNFGPLNCLPDRRPVARTLARWIQPGGLVLLVVMGPICPWEIGWHLLHGQPEVALRRLRWGVNAQVGVADNGVADNVGNSVAVWYPSPRRLAREFHPQFRVRRLTGLGAWLPPSYLSHLVDRWPAIFEAARALEQVTGSWFPWTWLNDHYLLVLERR